MREQESGRELDAIVAERVMGLTVVARNWPCGYSPDCGDYEASLYADYRDGDGSWFMERGPVRVRRSDAWPPRPDEYDPTRMMAIVEPIPFYSRNLQHAWDLLAWWWGDVDLRRQNGSWRVELFKPSAQWEAWADTLPLAICRAALRAALEG